MGQRETGMETRLTDQPADACQWQHRHQRRHEHEHSRRGYNDPSSNTNELLWNGQISKTFLKDKSLIVALNFYDLLGQQSNYERWVSATGRSDTRYNSINSYAMLHVRYRLHMFGGKKDTEGRYDKKWGNRDQR